MAGPYTQKAIEQIDPNRTGSLTQPTSVMDRIKAMIEPSVVAPPAEPMYDTIAPVGMGGMAAMTQALKRGTKPASSLVRLLRDYGAGGGPEPSPVFANSVPPSLIQNMNSFRMLPDIGSRVKEVTSHLNEMQPWRAPIHMDPAAQVLVERLLVMPEEAKLDPHKVAAMSKATGSRPPIADPLRVPEGFKLPTTAKNVARDPSLARVDDIWRKFENAPKPKGGSVNKPLAGDYKKLSGTWQTKRMTNQASQLAASRRQIAKKAVETPKSAPKPENPAGFKFKDK